jgi:hypothetical protein
MHGMTRPPKLQSVYYRMPALVKRAIDRMVTDLQADGQLLFNGEPPSREQTVCATFLWLEEMGSHRVAAELDGPMRRYEAIMRGEPLPPAQPRDAPPAGNPGPADDIPEHPEVDVELETPAPPSRRPRKRGNSG